MEKYNGMKWKWNEIRMEKLCEKKSVGYVGEMERKWNGNGMDFFLTKWKQILMEWNGMEMEWN